MVEHVLHPLLVQPLNDGLIPPSCPAFVPRFPSFGVYATKRGMEVQRFRRGVMRSIIVLPRTKGRESRPCGPDVPTGASKHMSRALHNTQHKQNPSFKLPGLQAKPEKNPDFFVRWSEVSRANLWRPSSSSRFSSNHSHKPRRVEHRAQGPSNFVRGMLQTLSLRLLVARQI